MRIYTKELRQNCSRYKGSDEFVENRMEDLSKAADELDRLYPIEAEYQHAVLCMDRCCKRCVEQATKRGLLPA